MNMIIKEGGNAIKSSIAVPKKYIAQVVKSAISALPKQLQKSVQTDIGSAGYKAESGDIDVFIDAQDVINFFKVKDEKEAKKALQAYLQKAGLEAIVAGRNVHTGIQFPGGVAQVDFMIIADTPIVAPWHQHGPRGSYNDPDFKGSQVFILMNSIGKPLGVKFDAFGGKLLSRETNEVIARDRDSVAKILLNPNATGDDLNSVKSIMKALANDPRKDEKLAQAREDVKKGLIVLPEAKQSAIAKGINGKTAVLTYGRMNPPTVGHALLINKVLSIPGDHFIFLSHTQDNKKNPLTVEDKLRYVKMMYPSENCFYAASKENPTIVTAASMISSKGYDNLIIVVGSDRIPAFEELFTKYNGVFNDQGQGFKFNSIKFVSAGERDPDADGTEGMSASKMRQLALDGDVEGFKQGLHPALQPIAQEIIGKITAGLAKPVKATKKKATESINFLGEDASSLPAEQIIKKAAEYVNNKIDPDYPVEYFSKMWDVAQKHAINMFKGDQNAPGFHAHLLSLFQQLVHKLIAKHTSMNESKSYITEGARIQHAEDVIFWEGSQGAIRALQNLAGVGTSKDVSLKWDGSPALYFGRLPNGQFVLTDKSGFTAKGYNGLVTSAKDLENMFMSRGKEVNDARRIFAKGMAALWDRFEAVVPEDFRGFVKGDLLYSKKPQVVDGHYTFTPNTVTYSVDINSDIGKRMSKTTAGIAVHSYTEGPNQEDQPIDINQLNTDTQVLIFGPTFIEHAPKLDTKKIKAGQSYIQKYSSQIDKLLDNSTLSALKLTDLADVFYTYVNAMVKAGSLTNLAAGFTDWLSTSKVSGVKQQKIAEYVNKNKVGFTAMFNVVELIMKIKDDIIDQLDSADAPIKASINGQMGGEGYVRQDLKLVNRSKFSAANFAKER